VIAVAIPVSLCYKTDIAGQGDCAMVDKERRRVSASQTEGLRRELNEAQKFELASLERFGWELKFVRRPLFQVPIPVVFDGERKKYAVLEPDGTLNENPGFKIRD